MPIRDNIEPPAKRAARNREEREVMLSGALWGAVGVMVLLMVIGAFWMFTSGLSVPKTRGGGITVPIAEDRHRTSPKEELSNMGIPRDENNFRSAIDRNDTKVVSMFLRTGMNWKLSWTEQAMAADYNEVLDMLLRYRLQMDENRPCRRFITTLSHEMQTGKKLTSTAKNYLRAFCTLDPVVERQRYEMEQAQLRYKADPSDENRKLSDIQSAIYDVID